MLEELCVQVRQALETWVDGSSGERGQLLGSAIDACDQVSGSLAVINFESGELMARGMRDALARLDQDGSQSDIVQIVLEATAVLPDYLDYAESTESDPIGLIMPMVNDLRVAAGKPALDKAEFFPVTLAGVRPPEALNDGNIGFSTLRRDLQIALRDYLTQRNAADLEALKQAVLRVCYHPLLPNGVRRMAWALAGLTELIQAESHGFSADVSRHYSRLDSFLKEVCGEADQLTVGDRADSAVRAVLYLVASTEADMPVCRQLREAFDFERALAESSLSGSIFLAGHSSDLFRAVARAAREDLARIKDTLGSLLEKDRNPAVMNQQIELLRSVGESLSMIGLNGLGERIANQAESLKDVGPDADNPVLMQVARELIVVESSLSDGFAASASESLSTAPDDDNVPGTLLPKSEYKRILRQLWRECNEDLAHVKHLLDAVNRGQSDADGPAEAKTILARISEALKMAQAESAASLLDAASRIVEADLIESSGQQSSANMAALAETLTAIEFHLEEMIRAPSAEPAEAILRARQRLLALGFLDEPQPEEVPSELDEHLQHEDTPPEDVPEASDATGPTAKADDDFDLLEIFLEEFDQEYESLLLAVPVWTSKLDDKDVLRNIRRSFHSLKGSGRMAGAVELGDFSWKFEKLLNHVLEGRVKAGEALVNLVAEAVRALPSLRARLAGSGSAELDAEACQALAQRAEELLTPPPAFGERACPPEMAELDATLLELMIKELSDHLEALRDWVADSQLRDVPGYIGANLVRAVHTIKGTMRLAPIADECETAQFLESYLDELALCDSPPSLEGQQAIEQCLVLFEARLARLELQDVPDQNFRTADLAQRLARLQELAHRKRTGEIEPGDAEPAAALDLPSESDSDPFAALKPGPDEFMRPDGASEVFRIVAEAEVPVADEKDVPDGGAAVDELIELPDELASERELESASEPTPQLEPEDHTLSVALAQEAAQKTKGETLAIDYASLDPDLLDAFLEEAMELLEDSDGLLHKWHETPTEKGIVFGLQRNLHTLKGGSRMVGLNPIGQIAHAMEELLDSVAAGVRGASEERINAIEAGCDHLNDMIEAVLERQALPIKTLDELFAEQIAEMEASTALAEEEVEGTRTDADAGTSARAETLRVRAALIDDLVNQAGEVSIYRSRLDQRLSQLRANITEVDETVLRLRNQLRKLELETEAQILARFEREHGPGKSDFDPLELDRYSTLQQLSRALAESVNDLTSLSSLLDEGARQSESLLLQQSRVNTELQEGLMQARMVSFRTLLPRFRRVVRNSARELGRHVDLDVVLEGEGELDRNVLDRMTAPIEHLLRNSISHGIEPPELRAQRGKDPIGRIVIDVRREATELVIRVGDDGQGLDLDKIRQRALARGLIDEDEQLSEQDLIQLIFVSGLSTSEQVSELAGRGIGMNVVSDTVRQIGGSILIDSKPGQGLTFIIRLPLSLTVVQAIHARVSDRVFAIPLQVIRGVVRLPVSDWLEQLEAEQPAQNYAGGRFPLLELEPQLDFAIEAPQGGTLNLLMIEIGDQRAALKVPELLGHREIVIKPVGPQISSITGILGATVSSDGQVVPILDLGPLIRRAFAKGLVPGGDILDTQTAQPEAKRTPLILVVDDSITVRRVTSRVLEQNGFEVLTARDGLDAVESLVDRVPDLILLDIEMPRMDGYELATHVRNDRRLKHIPMIMITSRSGEKHRQRAAELGVNDYMSKPYHENDLLARVFAQLERTEAAASHE